MVSVSVILATYDEATNIARLIDSISGVFAGRDFEIVVVDDNSPDGTWKIAQEKAKTNPRVRVIHRVNERGLTSALNRGIKEATKDVVAWLDCDFQHPPEKLGEMLALMDEGAGKGFDAIVGSRYLGHGPGDLRLSREHEDSAWVRFHGRLSVWICKVTAFVLRSPFTDFTSGLIAVKRKILLEKPLLGNYGEYFMFLLHRLSNPNFNVKEIPYVLDVRKSGYSKTSGSFIGFFRKGLRYLWVLKELALTSLREPQPKAVRKP